MTSSKYHCLLTTFASTLFIAHVKQCFFYTNGEIRYFGTYELHNSFLTTHIV